MYAPVNRTLSLTAACFGMTGCIVQAVGLLFHVAPLIVLGKQTYLSAFTPEQLQAQALIFLACYAKAYNISLVFFGFYLLLIGYLTFRSGFLPRWLGVLVMFGVGWVTLAYPPFQHALGNSVILSSIGEGLLVLWLAFKGVDEKRWHELAAQQPGA
jgi:hypothetical protein